MNNKYKDIYISIVKRLIFYTYVSLHTFLQYSLMDRS